VRTLGEMTKLGMRVPPGFAISVDGFEKYMQVTGLGKRIETYFASQGNDLKKSIQKQMDASRVAKDLIAATPLPADMVHEIGKNYEGSASGVANRICPWPCARAVREHAWSDGDISPCPGQFGGNASSAGSLGEYVQYTGHRISPGKGNARG